jgi:hypothetical protein
MALRPTALQDSSAGYGFEWFRAMSEGALQEGVLGANDLKVSAAVAGGMRVDIASGTAFVKGDSGTPGTGLTQGLNDANMANALTLTAAHATLPRLDQICLQINDSSDLGSSGDTPAFVVVTGTATGGATLPNRNGAAALPTNTLRLADVLVPAASSSVTAGNIRDRRSWARRAVQSLYAAGPTVQPGTSALISGMSARLEIATGFVEVRVSARVTGTNTDSTGNIFAYVDAVQTLRGEGFVRGSSTGGHVDVSRILQVTAGSHLFEFWHGSGVNGGTSISDYELFVRELPVAANNGTS